MSQAGENTGAARQFMPLEQVYRLVEEHRASGRLDQAEELLNQVLETRPNEPQAIHYLGIIAHQRGKLTQAIEHLKRAVELAPKVALFQANLGEMYRLSGRADLAIQYGERALSLQPDYPEALSNVGIAYYEQKDYAKALGRHQRAVELKPDFALAHSNMGNALHALRRFEGAVACYRRAVALAPDFADAWSNLGTSLHHSGEYAEGMACLRRAVALDPRHANAHSGLGILLLLDGQFAEGWEEYEWRLVSSEVKTARAPERAWRGDSLAGRRIHIDAEQGFGDVLQFARYLPLLKARAAGVSVRVQQELVSLLRASLPGIEVLGRGPPAHPPDCDAVLMSLPRLLKTRLETIPWPGPYLRPPDDIAARWQGRLSGLKGLKVGIAWAGNPEHVNDLRRSIEFKQLAPLFALPGVSFVSLQVGPRAADAKARKTLVDLSADLADFAASAGAVAALDLVITIDSSVAHLAGGLGKPVWLLLPWVTDWRWMLRREDSPWYPSLRIFRQAKGEAWSDVVARAAAELKAAKGKRTRLEPFREAGEQRAANAAEIIAVEAKRAAQPQAQTAEAMSLPHALASAERLRAAGQLGQADALCRRILEANPSNAEAFHLLGIIAHQSGHLPQAIEHLKRATDLAPEVALYHANLGEMCRLAKRTGEAVAEGRRALALKPDYPEALSNLGIALYEQGQYEEAAALYRRAVGLKPDFTEAHSNLGNALRALKRFDEAVPCYRRAIELRPGFADGWNNLGTTLRDLKKPEEAEAAYRKALGLSPDSVEVMNNLALCLKDIDRLDEAETLLRRSLAIEGRNAKTLLYLATLLLDRHQTDEAAKAAAQARDIEPNNHDIVNLMGRIAFERNDLAGAEAQFRRALELKPDLADALNNMGNVLKELGRLDAARESYVKSLALDSGVTGVYVNYADSVKFTADNPHLKAMESLRDGSAPLSDTDRLQLDFALAKAYADLKNHKRSFERLLSGNALKRAKIQYDEAAALALFDRIETAFTAKLLREKEKLGGGDPSSVPIFVLGMPRSGTTLVEQILASHPDVHGAGELKTLNDVVNEVRGPDGQTIPYPEFVPGLDARALGQIGARYLAEICKLAPEAKHITDKMPSNYYFAGLIHLALPNARIVHTVRDPVDTCVSCFSKLFTAEQNHTYDLAELGRYHRRYQQLMEHWRRVLPAGRILDVRYEEVVADLEGQARRIVAFCGLAWDARCLSFHQTDRPVRTASASQVRQPIYNSAVGRARVYEAFLGPLKDALAGSNFA